MPKALVIGGTGPTGVPIVENLLRAGFEVTIYHTGNHERSFTRPVHHVHGDPRDRDRIASDLGERQFDLTISTSGRLRYLAQHLARRTRRFVAITGLPAYHRGMVRPGETGLPMPIPETDPVVEDPSEGYGHAVAQGEKLMLQLHNQGAFEATIVRYTGVYGPYSYVPFEWYWVRRIRDGRQHILLEGDGLGLPQRGCSENLAHAVTLAATSPRAAGQVYNAGDERTLTLRALTELIAEALGHHWEVVSVPLTIGPCRNPLVQRQHTLLDLHKLRSELGYRDLVSVEEATARTVRWMAEHPYPYGGLEEANLGEHAFDYGEEDRYIAWARSWVITRPSEV